MITYLLMIAVVSKACYFKKDVSELNCLKQSKVRIGCGLKLFLQVGIFHLSKHLNIGLQTLLSSVRNKKNSFE